MKKIVMTLALVISAAVSLWATDMTFVWEDIQKNKDLIVAEVPSEKAAANGFETLHVALHPQANSASINQLKRLIATIDDKQKVTTVSQQGVDVSVYIAPASTDGTLYKLMIVVDKNDNADKALIVLYGTCTPAGMNYAIQKLSIEDIIGG